MTWTRKETDNVLVKEGELRALKAQRDVELKPLHNFINQNALSNLSTEDLAAKMVNIVDRLCAVLQPYVAVPDQALDPTVGGEVKPNVPAGQPINPNKSTLTTGIQGSLATKIAEAADKVKV